MGSLEKIKIKKIKEVIVQGYDEDIRTVITQYEQTYDDESLYKVFVITKYGGELFNVVQSCITDNRVKSDKHFSDFVKKYRGRSKTINIF